MKCNMCFLLAWILMAACMTLLVVALIEKDMVSTGDNLLGIFEFCKRTGGNGAFLACAGYTEFEHAYGEDSCNSAAVAKLDGGDSIGFCHYQRSAAAFVVFSFLFNFAGMVGEIMHGFGHPHPHLATFGLSIGGISALIAMSLWAHWQITYDDKGVKRDQFEWKVGAAFGCVCAVWILDLLALVAFWRGGMFGEISKGTVVIAKRAIIQNGKKGKKGKKGAQAV